MQLNEKTDQKADADLTAPAVEPFTFLFPLCRLQNSYTASQRANQDLEEKLHALVSSPPTSTFSHTVLTEES